MKPQIQASRRTRTVYLTSLLAAVLSAVPSSAAHAQALGQAAPKLVLKESVQQMPRSDTQEVRVLTASFKPGDKTVFHTHRSPVTVYVLEGQFTLDLEGREPVVISAGQAYVEPPGVKMTGYNRSATAPLRVVIFYVSEPGTPFLDPAH
ncbi:MAG: cupin domain-containing protein [Polaromonas sp.]|uniref:cupin domain-containing protein n=1 Tax=Polaromonas sp. TaxID=1869339 RepID=UPI0017961D6A|nr:cupin domain-containing protein [Polaromonas sp.]NMM11590.1 cupin domain-containing protein [Polaromonas sp.]